MVKCLGCGLDGDIWRLRDGYCKSCREAKEEKPKTNLIGFYEDDQIYTILEGIRVAIVNLTNVISCESISGGHQSKNGKCEICNTKTELIKNE